MIGNTWKGSLNQIKEMRDNFKRNETIMTPYERVTNAGEIKRVTEMAFSLVAGGVIGEYRAAVAKAKDGIKGIERAKANEINRWKPDALRVEFENAKTLVGMAAGSKSSVFDRSSATKKIQTILEEAKASGDLHKQRAVLEVIQSLEPSSLDDKQAAAILIGQAKRDLDALRHPPEIDQAIQTAKAAWDAERAKRAEVIDASIALGNGNPTDFFADGAFAKILRTVEVKNGEVLFHDENSPEVTRIVYRTPEGEPTNPPIG